MGSSAMRERYLVLERSARADLRTIDGLYEELDPARLRLALDQALALKLLYSPQIERFLQFVQSLG